MSKKDDRIKACVTCNICGSSYASDCNCRYNTTPVRKPYGSPGSYDRPSYSYTGADYDYVNPDYGFNSWTRYPYPKPVTPVTPIGRIINEKPDKTAKFPETLIGRGAPDISREIDKETNKETAQDILKELDEIHKREKELYDKLKTVYKDQ
jgi:hypothetical protein